MAENQNSVLEAGSDSILFAHKAFKFLEDQQYDEALTLCEAGVKQFPFYAEGHFILGKCYQTIKKYDDAKNEYERTLSFMPNHIRALNALAYIYHKMDLAPKANDLLIQALLYNPYNKDLIGYLRAENLYDALYNTSPASPDIQSYDQKIGQGSYNPELELADDPTRELITEINDMMPESSEESTESWETEADKLDARELLPFGVEDDAQDDSAVQFGDDPEIVDNEQESVNGFIDDSSLDTVDLEKPDEKLEGDINIIESELNDISDSDMMESDSPKFDIEDSSIDESFMDDSFIRDNSGDEFFLESEDSKQIDEADEEITKIDEFASSKDEITELSIDQYEVNNIVDNLVESDLSEDSKTDLSKFANTDDDFSTLMNGIFEERDLSETDEEPLEGLDMEIDEDETQMAEERPILDTSIIFMDRDQPDISAISDIAEEAPQISDDQPEEPDYNIPDLDEDETGPGAEFDLAEDEEDIDFNDTALQEVELTEEVAAEDEISKVIDKIEKKGEKPFEAKQTIRTDDKTEIKDQLKVEELASIEDENASIEEILDNPKMLTPTFGEILIAQKKFGDAQRVFTALSKKDPNNSHLKRKIEFLNKLVKFEK